jgi:GT2 family glycosyltransferase
MWATRLFLAALFVAIPWHMSMGYLGLQEGSLRGSALETREDKHQGNQSPGRNNLKTLLLISTCNHVEYTVKFVESLKAVSDQFDLLVVDDHSVDGTPEILRRMGVRVMTKDAALGLTHSWNLAYSIFKEGYRQRLYTNMIIANNDLLIGEGGIDLVRQALLQHPLVVPMSTTLGVGHNPPQSIEAILSLDEGDVQYVNVQGNHERVQAGLVAKAVESGLSFTPSPNRFNGFFFAFRAPDIFAAEYTPGVLFDTDRVNTGQEDHLIRRLKPQGIIPMISHDIFVFHFKSVTVKGLGHSNEERENLESYHPELKGSVVGSENSQFAQQFAIGVLNADVLNQGSAALGDGASTVVALPILGPTNSLAAKEREFGNHIERVLGWTVRYLGQPDWYDLHGVDVLIAVLPQYNSTRIANEKATLVKIGWLPRPISELAEIPNGLIEGFGAFDLVLISSEEEKDFLNNQQPFGTRACTFRCGVSTKLVSTAANATAMQKWAITRAFDRWWYKLDPIDIQVARQVLPAAHHVPVEVLHIAGETVSPQSSTELYEAMTKHSLVPVRSRVDFTTSDRLEGGEERKTHYAPRRVCAITRVHTSQAGTLEASLLNLVQQDYEMDKISMRAFLQNIDPVAYQETKFMVNAAAHVNSAVGYQAVTVMEASPNPLWAHAQGYEYTDAVLDTLLDASDCTHFLFTSDESAYSSDWLRAIAGEIEAGKQIIASCWSFKQTAVDAFDARNFVGLGAVLVDRRAIERGSTRFVSHGIFTGDMFTREWRFFKSIHSLVGGGGLGVVTGITAR